MLKVRRVTRRMLNVHMTSGYSILVTICQQTAAIFVFKKSYENLLKFFREILYARLKIIFFTLSEVVEVGKKS